MPSKVYRYGPEGRRIDNKWRARVKHNWTEYYLGMYDDKDSAIAREREFRAQINR